MFERSTKAPSITRVHKLFRLRTIVNDMSLYDPNNDEGVKSRKIGEILVDRKLSNISILNNSNTLRRARDHAFNSLILGLILRIPNGSGFRYIKSSYGKILSEYMFENECPYNLHESAIFVDRMMRLKLNNPNISRNTYSKFHTRPFLSILNILKYRSLHKSQIHYLLSIHNDLCLHPDIASKLIDKFSNYRSYDKDEIERFIEDHELSDKLSRREIDRTTKPLIAWAQQGRLLMTDRSGWCNILENGKEAERYYSQLIPIWYDQLGFNAPLQSALLILYQYAYEIDLRIHLRSLPSEYQEVLKDLITTHNLWNRRHTRLRNPIDFNLDYDIPYSQRAEVEAHIEKLFIELDLPEYNLDSVALSSVQNIELRLELMAEEINFNSLSKAIGIHHLPRPECFQTPFEWETCVRLLVFGLPAKPYNGEYTGETILRIAYDNPDVIIKNNIKTLVECKSRKEWGNIVRLGKSEGGEILMYQKYAEDIKADSALFVCEAEKFHPIDFIESFAEFGDELNKIIMTTWDYLEEVQETQSKIEELKAILKAPEEIDPHLRILVPNS